MDLLFFWINVAKKRIFDFSKPYFLIVVCTVISIGSFIYALINGHNIIELDIKSIYIITAVIIFLSQINSFRNYPIMKYLIKYKKSKYKNKTIYLRYFIKRAFINNLLLTIFYIIAFFTIINDTNMNTFYIFILLGILIFSVTLSFIIMCFKYIYFDKENTEINIKKLKISPLIKSALSDYVSSDFLITFLCCVIIFIAYIIKHIKDTNNIYELNSNPLFFMVITIIFSIGYTGIIGSISNINWKFQAINSLNSFKYHLKRTFFVLAGFFGWLILLFIFFGVQINMILTIKYIFCIFVILFTIVNISFTIINVMIKMFIITVITFLTLWVSTIPSVFLATLIIPIIITFIRAKNEYREWALL
jgi:hypothetical protein